ncbi:MAG: hypothetical protein ACOC57_01095 [Acidobacteriota bacterium]
MKYIRFKHNWIKNKEIKTGLADNALKTCTESISKKRYLLGKSESPEVLP